MITREQALSADVFHYGQCTRTHGPRGGERLGIEQWRRNGATKTWKTRPDDFRVPVKWGMRNYHFIDPSNADQFHTEKDCPLHAWEYRRVGLRDMVVEVSKAGGGALGMRYTGDWNVRATDRHGKIILDDVMSTVQKELTHAEAAGQAMVFIDGS